MKTDWSNIHSRKAPLLWSVILAPLSLMYGLGVRVRVKGLLGKRKKFLPGFVLSVGNLTTGGTGKTPAVRMLAEWAVGEGCRVAVLSRGYGGRHGQGFLEVSDGEHVFSSPSEAGDEPCLLAASLKGVPVVIARERYLAGLLAHEKYGADFYILDDGFQHLALHRDLDLVLLDAEKPFGNGHLLPWGPLREPKNHLERADAFVITRTDRKRDLSDLTGFLGRHFPEKPLFKSEHRPEALHFPDAGRTYAPEFLRGKRIVAFAGIARPGFFRETLKGLGAEPVWFKGSRDHHVFSDREIRELIRRKEDLGAECLVTTEKDWVRIKDRMPEVRDFAYLTIVLSLASKNALFEMIRDTLRLGK